MFIEDLVMRRNVLLLQGPVGPFFALFARDLENRGFNVFKVNFNGGDSLFYRRKRTIDYRGKLKDWEDFLERTLENRDIGRIYLFGDCRVYHRTARQVAERMGVRVFVFEEGYIRPNFITLEESGVNGNSPMVGEKIDLDNLKIETSREALHPRSVFIRTALYAMAYYTSAALNRRKFKYYQHHRNFNPITEGARWILSAYRKMRYRRKEKHVISELLPQFEGNYFLCPLQVHCDMQVSAHSGYNSIEHFIGDVITSFMEHAPKNKAIVFKHHPLDRGYTDYSLLFENLISENGLRGRVFYVHDVDLPTLLKHAQGTVLINSTVGMSSLFHGTPVKTLGTAIYDLPGVTNQQPLDDFWSESGSVSKKTYNQLRQYLVERNQINGSFYKPFPSVSNSAGLIWASGLLNNEHEFEARRMEASDRPSLKVVGGMDVETAAQDMNLSEEELAEIWKNSKSA